MKKIIKYLASPKSDFLLFVLLIVFANLVSSKSFARLDLTAPKSYSLSTASRQVVKTLENPLSVKVFFSDNLNAPYSSSYQYIKDILVEYKGSANKNFNYEFFDMKKIENERLARNYGLQQVQIQEVKNNEVGFKQVWMGLAITYADRIEIIDGITDPDGLEYGITSTISKMIATTSSLSGLNGKVSLTLYKTSKMSDFKIIGFNQVEDEIKKAFDSVNKKNMNRLEFKVVEPAQNEILALSSKYGIQNFKWENDASGIGAGSGIFGLVLEYGDKFNVIPLQITRDIFGRNVVAGLDEIESSLSDGIQVLVSKTQEIAYITGHGELNIEDEQAGAARFASIISDRYTLKPLNLASENIPSNISCVIINGPKGQFSDEELYKIDQFVMKGGNLMVFTDSFEQTGTQTQLSLFQLPTYEPFSTGIEKLLEKYGITLNKDIVYDENCYVNSNQHYGKMKFYFAPLLFKENFNQKNVITKNLGYVIFLENSSIDVTAAQNDKNVKVSVLAKSSPKSWKLDKDISLNPAFISVPEEKTGSENLAVLVEGKFSSAFEKAPEQNSDVKQDGLSSNSHLSKSVQNGKIFAISSSKVTTAQVLDENGEQPGSILMRNAVDYMNGESELCAMRTKGLSVNTLSVKSPASAIFAKYFNELGIVFLVVVLGLLVLVKIRTKKRLIRAKYNPNDERIISK